MIVLGLFLFCLLFTAVVKIFVPHNAIEGLFFYPASVQERVIAMGKANRAQIERRRKAFKLTISLVVAVSLFLMIGAWNGVRDFKTAYLQTLLSLEVMNVYDALVIDKLWVGHSRFWVIPGTEDLPFAKSWSYLWKERTKYAIVWVFGAAAAAGLVVLFFKEKQKWNITISESLASWTGTELKNC